jgi:hypothetical protein
MENKLINITKTSKLIGATLIVVALLILAGRPAVPEQACTAKPAGTLGPFADNMFHVQGLVVATDSIFITSVDSKTASAFLWKYDRGTFGKVKVRNIADNFMFHPSGFQYDGKYLWIAIAVYSEGSSAKVLKIDPETLRPIAKFTAPDHIGLVATNGDGIVYGGNWDAKKFYIWKENGKLIETRLNPTSHGYQDCKVSGEYLVCSGSGAVDFIHRDTWKVERTYVFQDMPNGNNPTREGMDFINGIFYFAPDDGAKTNVYIYESDDECKLNSK